MPEWLLAGGSGLIAGAALLLGSVIAWFVDVPRRVVAAVMAFGSGVLISARTSLAAFSLHAAGG